ncbi:hypothetical protein VNO77_15100 [Canavalia gladiata]|uniref:Uncharacterized protein n=1 Tax=Canavalia gladiata TaxID=3824 RepID=A0AAN9LYQ6_CANGL
MPEQPEAIFLLSVVDAVRCLPCLGSAALVMFLASTFAGSVRARRFAFRDRIHYSGHAVGACSKAKLASSACPRVLRSEVLKLYNKFAALSILDPASSSTVTISLQLNLPLLWLCSMPYWLLEASLLLGYWFGMCAVGLNQILCWISNSRSCVMVYDRFGIWGSVMNPASMYPVPTRLVVAQVVHGLFTIQFLRFCGSQILGSIRSRLIATGACDLHGNCPKLSLEDPGMLPALVSTPDSLLILLWTKFQNFNVSTLILGSVIYLYSFSWSIMIGLSLWRQANNLGLLRLHKSNS